MDPHVIIGKLYVEMAAKQAQLEAAIGVVHKLVSGEISLDRISVTDSGFIVSEEGPSMEGPAPTPIRGA